MALTGYRGCLYSKAITTKLNNIYNFMLSDVKYYIAMCVIVKKIKSAVSKRYVYISLYQSTIYVASYL